MPTHKVFLPTNFNNKLDCEYVVHVAAAPVGDLPSELVAKYDFEFITEDKSHPPCLFKLIDLTRFTLNEIHGAFTYPSHGMNSAEYLAWFMATYPNSNGDTKIAAYFYKKIQD